MARRRFLFEELQGRYRILVTATLLLFGVILGQLVHLQLIRGGYYRQRAEDNRIRPEILHAQRGRLLDRNGKVIADNAPTYHLNFDPRDRAFRGHPALRVAVARELARILDRDEEGLLAEVERARKGGQPPVTLARNLDFAKRSAILERPDPLPGVEVRPQPARRYPYGHLAAHLIGHLGEVTEEELSDAGKGPAYRSGDLAGRAGVERSYEFFLRGAAGVEYVEVDAHGRRTNLFEELPTLPSTPGQDLVLHLDLDLQLAAEAALDSVPSLLAHDFGEDVSPRPGAVVALDVKTGGVLAMANRPAFDPNLFVSGLSKEDWRILSGAGHPLLNRSIQSSYPPGSTFKIATALAGLHEGEITPSAFMPSACTGGMFFGNRTFRCHKKEGHGSLALIDAMARSCDVYFYQVGIRLGVDRLTRYAVACSIGVPTRIDLPQERRSLVPTLDWYRSQRGGPPGPGAALNLSIGQGELLLTPLSLARFTAAVLRGGALLRPRVVREVVSPAGERLARFDSGGETVGRLPATQEELAVVRRSLEAVVMEPGGTGRRAQVSSFRVGGKTGTSQNPHGDDHAWFVGYAPAEDPEIVVVVILEESGHGGAVAAPTAQRVLDRYLNPSPTPIPEVQP